ncbi:MAG: hypothetical protein ACLUW6_04910 [Coriobacteriaceae bacterium]
MGPSVRQVHGGQAGGALLGCGWGTVTVGVDVSASTGDAAHRLYRGVQDVVLFNGTVMENIRLGRRDATDEEVLAAAAGPTRRVRAEDAGAAPPIGENGALLSGGASASPSPGHSERRPHRASGRGPASWT